MNAWRDRAACRGLAFDLAFGGPAKPMIETCHHCPVAGPCLADALTDPDHHQVGIRGGLYAEQRVAILRGRVRVR